MHNPFSLEGKTILVTGASSGIGRSIAIECAKMGAKMVITGRNQERLMNTLSSLSNSGHSHFTANLADENEIESLIAYTPHIDGLVHCAGISMLKPLKFINKSTINDILNTNTIAPVFLTSRLLKAKKLKTNSSIVFISSISGVFISSVGESLYSASKGAINGFVKGAAIDLAPTKIRVNSINPGIIQTNLLDLAEEIFSNETLQNKIEKYPLKRFGNPEDVSYAAIYLLSNASSWVTGINLVIDGGFTLQ